MLISREQFQEIANRQEEEYCRRLAAFYKGSIPDQVGDLDEPTLLGRIREGLRRARGHRIRTGEGFAKFIGLCLLIRNDFDQDPSVQRYLESPELDPDVKVHILSELVSRNLKA